MTSLFFCARPSGGLAWLAGCASRLRGRHASLVVCFPSLGGRCFVADINATCCGRRCDASRAVILPVADINATRCRRCCAASQAVILPVADINATRCGRRCDGSQAVILPVADINATRCRRCCAASLAVILPVADINMTRRGCCCDASRAVILPVADINATRRGRRCDASRGCGLPSWPALRPLGGRWGRGEGHFAVRATAIMWRVPRFCIACLWAAHKHGRS